MEDDGRREDFEGREEQERRGRGRGKREEYGKKRNDQSNFIGGARLLAGSVGLYRISKHDQFNVISLSKCFSAIRRHIILGNLPSDAEGTATFVENMNNLFDILNCFGTKKQRPIYANDFDATISVSHKLVHFIMFPFLLSEILIIRARAQGRAGWLGREGGLAALWL